MSDFRYPDSGDALTAQLIANEYDQEYWARSEELVLDKAISFLERTVGTERMKKGAILDAGCGTGRLIPRFAPLFGRVAAFDPDEERAGEARELVASNGIGNATITCELSSDFRATAGADTKYAAILSSHVMQHIAHGTALDMLRDLRAMLSDDGVLLLTTAFTAGADSTYVLESADDEGKRTVLETDVDGFEAAMGIQGTLPVCRFSTNHITTLLHEAGFAVEKSGCFHFANEHDPANDEANSADAARLEDARDAYYFCTPLPSGATSADDTLSASGKVCFMNYYALDDRAITDDTLHRAELLSAHDEQAGDIMHEFEVVEGFLYGSNLHFPAKRFVFAGRNMSHRDLPFESSFVVVTLYPETGVCQVGVCFTFGDTPIDDLVYLHQTQHNPNAAYNVTASDSIVALRKERKANSEWVGTLPEECTVSIPSLCQQIIDDLKLSPIATSSAFLMELNEFGSADVPDDLDEQQRLALYGLLTGDEGWRHVPLSVVDERLDNCWGTRNFVKAVVFGNNGLLLNFNRGAAAKAYLAGQHEMGNRYDGGVNEYFTQDAQTACLNHGIFLSMETGMVAKAIAGRLLAARPRDIDGKAAFLNDELGRSKRYRTELIATLAKIESVGITEVGELDALVMKSLSVEERVSGIRELLELVESELDLSYETSTNRLVNFLTVLGLVFAVIQVVLAIPAIAG